MNASRICLVFFAIGSAMINCEEVSFRYVTAYNPEGRLLTKADIQKTTVNVLNPIIFLIEGRRQGDREDVDVANLQKEYLDKQINNVFLVKWNDDNVETQNETIQSAGEELGDFISSLYKKTEENRLDIHLVGILNGSAVASTASRRVSESTGRKVNRLTALDPVYNLINENATDFVDVVYSSSGGNSSCGDVRFYVGGCRQQPGSGGRLKSAELFAESINSNEFRAVKCGSVDDLHGGKCDQSAPIVFGEGVASGARGTYVLMCKSQ